MFERFHADARAAVVVARREAALMGQRDIGCSHLLLGIMSEPDGPGALALSAAGLDVADVRTRIAAAIRPPAEPLDADALASLGIDLDAVRRATEASFGQGALDRAAIPAPGSSWGAMRITRPARKSLELALKAAVKRRPARAAGGCDGPARGRGVRTASLRAICQADGRGRNPAQPGRSHPGPRARGADRARGVGQVGVGRAAVPAPGGGLVRPAAGRGGQR